MICKIYSRHFAQKKEIHVLDRTVLKRESAHTDRNYSISFQFSDIVEISLKIKM